MTTTLNQNTLEAIKNLVESVSRAELVEFIIGCDSSYTKATAENFLDYLKAKSDSDYKHDQERYAEFVLGVIWYSFLYYGYDFEKVSRNQLECYKSRKEQQAKEEASEYRKQARRANFRHLMLDYYRNEKTYDETKKEILGKNSEDSRRARNCLEFKTLAKIQAKKQTKSHTLDKIIKLVDEDIERGYGDRAELTEAQKERANKIENSHWFISRW